MFSFSAWWGRRKPQIQDAVEDAHRLAKGAAQGIKELMEDRDENGLPDLMERLARHAATIVKAMEILKPGSGRGAEKLNEARARVLDIGSRALDAWQIIEPLIEASVKAMNKRRAS